VARSSDLGLGPRVIHREYIYGWLQNNLFCSSLIKLTDRTTQQFRAGVERAPPPPALLPTHPARLVKRNSARLTPPGSASHMDIPEPAERCPFREEPQKPPPLVHSPSVARRRATGNDPHPVAPSCGLVAGQIRHGDAIAGEDDDSRVRL